jgi:predicted MPP superfamily phosphohydrolase
VNTAGSVGSGGYALAEPFRLNVTRYAVSPPNWPKGLRLRVVVIADIHVCEPWMSLERVRQIVARTNALAPDIVLLPGDFVASHRISKMSGFVPHDEWARALAQLNAPLGRHAVLGNHDWWEDIAVQRRRSGPVAAAEALERAGVPVYENDVMRLKKDGRLSGSLGSATSGRSGRSVRITSGSAAAARSTAKASMISMARLRKPLTMHR